MNFGYEDAREPTGYEYDDYIVPIDDVYMTLKEMSHTFIFLKDTEVFLG